jgi:activating signal cointegrator 1
VKAISLYQPWAVLCLVGAKQFETRNWHTQYRGPLLIHAALKADPGIKDMARSPLVVSILRQKWPDYSGWKDLRFGAVVGQVQLIACHRMRDIQPPSDRERQLGDWSPNRYAWEFESPQLFDSPIPYRGQQGLFEVNQEVLAA